MLLGKNCVIVLYSCQLEGALSGQLGWKKIKNSKI